MFKTKKIKNYIIRYVKPPDGQRAVIKIYFDHILLEMPIDLYYYKGSPPCKSVQLGLKQLALDVNLKSVDLSAGEQLKPEYTKMNPNQTVPTIVDNGFVLQESRAILQYLVNKYAPNSPLYPTDPQKRANVDKILYFDMAFITSIRDAIVMKVLKGVEPTKAQTDLFKKNMQLMDTLIGDRKYVANNELTIADLSVVGSLGSLAKFASHELDGYPNTKNYLDSKKKELKYYNEVFG